MALSMVEVTPPAGLESGCLINQVKFILVRVCNETFIQSLGGIQYKSEKNNIKMFIKEMNKGSTGITGTAIKFTFLVTANVQMCTK